MDIRHLVNRWLRLYVPAFLGLWLMSGTASALDCWVPTIDSTQPQYRKMPLPNIRGLVAAGEQIARDNPHFKAMPRPIRIRDRFSVGPSHAQLNINAYQPLVWEGKCGLVQGADRCCGDGNITVMVNAPENFLPNLYGRDDQLKVFREPRRTGTVAGFPEYELHLLMSVDGRVPWLPVSVAELLDMLERQESARLAEVLRAHPAVYGIDPEMVRKSYEGMKKVNPKAAEEYRAKVEAQMPQQAADHEKRTLRAEQLAAARVEEVRKARASFTPAQLAAQAHHGVGPLNLGRADDPRSYPLVKPDPSFPDRSDPDRVQLISVFVSVVKEDPVIERRETMQRTKETLEYGRLAKFLR